MASVFELANLSAMAYHSTRVKFESWFRRISYGYANGKGFYAEAYRNNIKREIVLAIRGTDFKDKDWRDIVADIQIASGQVPYQLNEALTAYDKESTISKRDKFKIYLTGHSLGGGLSSLVAAKRGDVPVVTFNAPGMLRSFVSSHFIDLFGLINYHLLDKSRFLHIRASGDLVSMGPSYHMGKVEDVYVDNWGNGNLIGASRHLAQHSIDNMVACLKPKYWYHKDLNIA